jgi:outer membrane protein assembly factor BamB
MQQATHFPLAAMFLFTAICAPPAAAGDWRQFRGPNGSGLPEPPAAGSPAYPGQFGPGLHVAWEVSLPPGISSPCVVRDRILLTAFVREPGAPAEGTAGKRLVTLALDRASGKVVWERAAPIDRLEEVHSIGSPATPTPASDGDTVHVFFGSYGLLAYDLQGQILWQRPLGPFKNNYGQASSPIVVGERVFQLCDQDIDSFLLAVDRRTGKTLWERPRPGFPRGFSTPIVWDAGSGPQLLVAGTLRLIAYHPGDGRELWSVGGLARIVNTLPVLGEGLLFAATYAPGGDAEERISMEPFAEFARRHDADRDGHLALSELPDGPFRVRFPQIDVDKDGRITPREWDDMGRIFEEARNCILAVRPGGQGDATATHVAWTYARGTPYVPSPLYLEGRVYTVKDSAIFTCLEAQTGKVLRAGRLAGAPGNYYSSLVATPQQILAVSQAGVVSFIRPGADWEVVATADLGETCMATPALADGRVYLRTEKRLFCFAR